MLRWGVSLYKYTLDKRSQSLHVLYSMLLSQLQANVYYLLLSLVVKLRNGTTVIAPNVYIPTRHGIVKKTLNPNISIIHERLLGKKFLSQMKQEVCLSVRQCRIPT